MSATSPSDLAITFRSIARRLREAQGRAPDAVVATPAGEIRRHVESAARVLHTSADAEAVAAAIAGRPADAWEVAELDALRANALEIGGLLRATEALGDHDDREDRG